MKVMRVIYYLIYFIFKLSFYIDIKKIVENNYCDFFFKYEIMVVVLLLIFVY